MEPEIRRVDPPQPATAVLLMQRGRLLLQALACEAHAARVDAQRAELESALAHAEAGDSKSLERWLAGYQSTKDETTPHLATAAPQGSAALGSAEDAKVNVAVASRSGLNVELPTTSPTSTARSWEMYIPGARQRLQAVQDVLRAPPAPAHKEPITLSAAASLTTGVVKKSKDTQAKLENHALVAATSPKHLPIHASSSKGEMHPPKQELLAIAKAFDASQAEEQTQKQRRFLLFSSCSGLGASLFVHFLVVIALMIITLKLPATTASLVFESSATEILEETVELTQPTEIATAEVTPDSASEVVTDPSESLAEISALTSAAFTVATPVQASSLSTLATAATSASASSGKPNPASANASFFGAAASGNCFCYVIDASESMRGGPWEAAKAELLRSLATLKENQRFYIVFFNKELSAISLPGEREPAPRPLSATREHLNHARGWIETLRIAPGAPPNKALKLAIEREPDAIYLLTDGDTKVDVAAFLRNVNRSHDFVNGEQVMVPIHAIAFYSRLGEELMRRIATENNGQFIYVPKPMQR